MINRADRVVKEPRPFIRDLICQCLPWSRHQCTTIPACERVKARNAPTAKRGTRACEYPLKTMIRMAVAAESSNIPFAKTSLSPRFDSWRAM